MQLHSHKGGSDKAGNKKSLNMIHCIYRLSHEDPQSHHNNLKQDENHDDDNILKEKGEIDDK